MPVSFVRKATPTDPILQAADRMQPKLSKAFLDAVQAMQDQVDVEALSAAISRGDANAAIAALQADQGFTAALNGKGIAGGAASFRDAIQATFAAGAQAAVTALPSKIALNMSFNLLSPTAVQHLENYSFNLIQQVSQDTRDSIQQTILRAFKEGGHPFEQAREIRDSIGLTARQEQAVANYKAALSGDSATADALNRALRDGRFDSTVARSIANQTPMSQAQVDKMVDRYRERYVKYRAENIARTESVRASNQGQRAAWAQAVEQGLIDKDQKRVWIVSGDDSTCSECLDLDGTEVGLDEEFDDGIADPPAHPSCRCTTALATAD